MTAKPRDITIERGADFRQEFDLPADIDLVDLQAAMQLRSDYGYPVLLTLTTQNGLLTVDAGRRKLVAAFDASVASAFLVGRCVYDNKCRESNGRITRLYEGDAVVTPEVTEFDFDGGGCLLLEAGGFLLLETGGRLLMDA